MEWQLSLLLIFGSLIVLMASGMPLAFCFMLINILGAFFFWGGKVGLEQLIHSIARSLMSFSFLPLPLFVLMGEVMFRSGIIPQIIDAVDGWLGRLPGRLGLLAVAAGTLMAALTGVSMASAAMLGSILVPEMEKRGYKKPMTLGPIMGSGGLAIMIPPSGLAVLLGAIGEISVGKLLIAIIVPGLLLATIFAIYIIVRCYLNPSIAPPYNVPRIPLIEKILSTFRYILPVGFIVFMVVGVMFLGVAGPTEAAATGAFGCFMLTAFYGRLNWELVKKSFGATLEVTGMILMIIAGAMAFAQNLAYCGTTRGLLEFSLGLPLTPLFMLLMMQAVLFFMGCFMEIVSIMMVTLPIFMPIANELGFDPVWFGVIYLLNMEMAQITPPFGTVLFAMKAVAPKGTLTTDVYKAVLPFLGCQAIAMALIIAIPGIPLWLPNIMR